MKRTTTIMGLAALAPLVVFGATLAAVGLREQGQRAIAERLGAAREINSSIDAELIGGYGALRVLAGSAAIAAQDWSTTRERARGVMRDNPGWRNVILSDARRRQELWDLHTDSLSPRPLRAAVQAYIDEGAVRGIGGIAGQPPNCPCIVIHEPVYRDGALRYVLSVEISPDSVQRRLLARMPRRDVAAVVDRRGNFIARTVGYPEKLGQPATPFVRAAISRAPRGVYEGVTYEGLKNRTVYETSSLSGFSTHVAMPAGQIGALGAGSFGLFLLAAAVASLVGVAGVVYAVREQARWRALQARRAQAERLEAIGQFASGVAHDFNNLLTVVLGNLRRLEGRLSDAAQARAAEHALLAAEKGSALVRQLLSFAHDKPIELRSVDLAAAVAAIEDLLRQTLGARVGLAVDVPPGVWVRTNPALFESALVNLVANARDAMPDGGEVTLAARPAAQRGFVDLLVSDNGPGMPPAVAARALDPFFTTKGQAGTGLGLAQVEGFMARCGGSIEIISAPRRGTTIRLCFPVSATPPSGEA